MSYFGDNPSKKDLALMKKAKKTILTIIYA
jgi:hypothetical protein